MSISLPLSKEVQKLTANSSKSSGSPTGRGPLSVERCLQHFTMAEPLGDGVSCPSCGEKTPTTKQITISKLPKVLCLHLKRFDAAHNKKIEDFVSFPPKVNMGPYLPHWYVSRAIACCVVVSYFPSPLLITHSDAKTGAR